MNFHRYTLYLSACTHKIFISYYILLFVVKTNWVSQMEFKKFHPHLPQIKLSYIIFIRNQYTCWRYCFWAVSWIKHIFYGMFASGAYFLHISVLDSRIVCIYIFIVPSFLLYCICFKIQQTSDRITFTIAPTAVTFQKFRE